MNPKGYNGLRSSGLQVPIGSQVSQEERQQMSFNQQHQSIAREIFVRTAANLLSEVDTESDCAYPTPDEYLDLSFHCQRAAIGYFEGLKAFIQSQQPPEQVETAAE
jgi:hypothetical protein